jgi:hypothetical protein
MALSQTAYSIIIPVLFLVLVELVSITKDAPVKSANMYTTTGESIDYGNMPYSTFAKSIAKYLPTFGRWTLGLGRFGLLHTTTSAYISIVIAFLIINAKSTNYTFLWGAVFLFSIFWILLPVFEVKEYDEMVERDIRPYSADYHAASAIFGVVLLLILITAVNSRSIPGDLAFGIGLLIFAKYHLYMTGLFGEMVIREVVAMNGGEEDVRPAYRSTSEK